MTDIFDHVGPTVLNDLLRMHVGKLLGQGQYRDVFEYRDPTQVIKLENRAKSFCNITEHELWHASAGTRLRRWLAPCIDISANGAWLIQRRTTPLPSGKLPDRVPSVLADLKPDNWGLFEGRVVCHDYGNNRTLDLALRRMKLVKRR